MISVRSRFALWIVCIVVQVIGLSASYPLKQLPEAATLSLHRVAAVIVFGAAAVVLGLIVTTPPNAIRLKPNASVFWIMAGTIWLASIRAVFEYGDLLGVSAGVAQVVSAFVLVLALQRVRFTPWLATCLVWTPAFFGPAAVSPMTGTVAILCVAGVVFCVPLLLKPGELTP